MLRRRLRLAALVAVLFSLCLPGLAGSAATAVRDATPALTEVPSMRTQTTDTFLTGKGYYETTAYTYSVNYQDGDGWSPIDNSLVSSSAAGFAYENKANRYKL